MTWETVIGLETHVELATRTKIFCSCTTQFGGAPNTHCCPVCTGMPGTLPVVNKKVVEFAAKTALALNCTVNRRHRFDRKNYFYPDLPKAYQVSQLYVPIGVNGRVAITTAAGEKDIRIHELHMEEDAGKLVHDPWIDQTRCDYNRCGVPLVEIVTEPDFRTAEEVVAYLEKLRSTLEYMGVSDCKMQEGSDGGGKEHPRWRDNLAFAVLLQQGLTRGYSQLARPIVLRNSRYNQQLLPGSLLVEVGGHGNTLTEAVDAARLWADNVARTLLAREKG